MNLYEVRISLQGAKPDERAKIFSNVMTHGHTEPSPSSLQQGLTLISHSGSEEDVRQLCTAKLRKKIRVEVAKVTKSTWQDGASAHSNYEKLIQNKFLGTGEYPDL